MLAGEAGRDILTGGLGADRFVYTAASDNTLAFAGRDLIRDFSHADGDKIDVSAIDALTGGGDDAFTFVAAGVFSHHAGELIVTAVASSWLVQADVNGDGVSDFALQVKSEAALTAIDFLL